MKIFLLFMAVLATLGLHAQDVDKLMETARTFSRQGDYDNALLVLNTAAKSKPGDLTIQKEIAYTYYRAEHYAEANNAIRPLLDREDADVQTYQIAGNILKGLGDVKECEKLYKKGIKKFPSEGALYFEYGEVMLTAQHSNEAIRLWEQGIQADPSYAGNYYHASKYYYFTGTNPALSLLYGEIFINTESYTVRSAEMKNILLDAYKKFFLQKPEPPSKKQEGFQQSVADVMLAQLDLAGTGINPESLTSIRTKFLVSWFEKYAGKYPYKLFDHLQFLLREGLFEAYNQWLFGAAANMAAFHQWSSVNTKKVNDFTYYQKNRVFRMPPGQNYQ